MKKMKEPRPKHNWARIRELYLKGDIDHPTGVPVSTLCRDFNVPFSTMNKRLKTENWRQIKKEMGDTSLEKVVNDIKQKFEEQNVKRIAKLSDISGKLMQLAEEVLDETLNDETKTTREKIQTLKALNSTAGISSLIKDLALLTGNPTERKEKVLQLPDNWKELPANELDKYLLKDDLVEVEFEVEDAEG